MTFGLPRYVAELEKRAEWYALLARAANQGIAWWHEPSGWLRTPKGKWDCTFSNGLPVEREDLRKAIEGALKQSNLKGCR